MEQGETGVKSNFLKPGHVSADPIVLGAPTFAAQSAQYAAEIIVWDIARLCSRYERHLYLFERKRRIAVFLSRQRRPKRHA